MARLSSFLARRPHDGSPWGVDSAARDFWKLTGVAIVFNVVVAVCAYWIFSFIRVGPLQLLFIWFPGSSELSVGDRVLVGGCG